MNIIKKIWDFCVKSFHFVEGLWVKICVFTYRKDVDANILEELCGYIHPSYSALVDRFQEVSGQGGLLQTDVLVHAFYDNREEFLTRLRELLDNRFPYSKWADSLYEEFRAICAPIPEKFTELVKQKRLKGRVNLFEDALLGSVVEFKKLNVKGKMIHLCLGGRFNHWSFKGVRFFGETIINIYPPYFIDQPTMNFQGNRCDDNFTCLFAFVEHIDIADNEFKSFVSVGADMRQFRGNERGMIPWVNDMRGHKPGEDASKATVTLFKNRCKRKLILYNRPVNGKGGITVIDFAGRNTIGGLSLPSVPSYADGKRIRACNKQNQPDGWESVDEIYFHISDKIKNPLNRGWALHYKDYFIALKNEAIKKRDREDEFKYGRQERYFDWCLADHWQDIITLGWSHLVSNSGISWFRPIICLLAVQMVLAAAFISWNVLTCACDWNWRAWADWGAWAEMVVKSLDPLSGVKAKCVSPLSAAIYGVARKIFLFLFLYEIIKVFRRFPNKPSSG